MHLSISLHIFIFGLFLCVLGELKNSVRHAWSGLVSVFAWLYT